MYSAPRLDCAGRRRSPATLSGFHQGRPPRNKGLRYPPDPPTVEEIIAVMRTAGDRPDGLRLRGVIVVLWRAGLRVSESLALAESDLDKRRGAVLVRRGKGGKRREVGSTAGPGSSSIRGSPSRAGCRSAPVLRAPRTHRRTLLSAGIRTRLRKPLWRPASGGGSRRTSSATPTQSRCPRRGPAGRHPAATRSGRLAITSSTCAGSTTPKSSTPSTPTSTDDPGHHRSEPRSLTGPGPGPR